VGLCGRECGSGRGVVGGGYGECEVGGWVAGDCLSDLRKVEDGARCALCLLGYVF
jgi:hypothetical protein